MREIIFNNEQGLVCRTVKQEVKESETILVDSNMCLVETPVVIGRGDKESIEDLLPPEPLLCCNVGKAQEVQKTISNIRPGDILVSAVVPYTGRYWISDDRLHRVESRQNADMLGFIGLHARMLHAVRQAEVTLGSKIVVVGLGLSGILSCIVSSVCGGDVLAVDDSALRLKRAEGIDINTVSSADSGYAEDIRQFSNGIGADILVISGYLAGQSMWEQVWNMVRPGGKLVVVQAQDVYMSTAVLKEKNITIQTASTDKQWDEYFAAGGLTFPQGYAKWNRRAELRESEHILMNLPPAMASLITYRTTVKKDDSAVLLSPQEFTQQAAVIATFA